MNVDSEPIVCVPGQRLCIIDKVNIAGPGTYEQQGYIFSKLTGIVKVINEENVCMLSQRYRLLCPENTRTIEVNGITEQSTVPAPGDIVTALVTLVNQRFCKCSIKCIGDIVLTRPYRGIIKKEDVRSLDRDKVEMYKSFRPGDIVLARVAFPVVQFKNVLDKSLSVLDELCARIFLNLKKCLLRKNKSDYN